jgi:glycosyltransferase involved in cell wall biosynthesis
LAGAKLVFEIHDLWPLSPMELGGYSKYHPFIFVMQIAENFAYRFSDKIISILPKTNPYCIKHGMKAEKFYHVPNGFPDDQVNLSKPLPFNIFNSIEESKKSGHFLVGYAGGHSISNALNYLIDAAIKLKNEKVHFFLVGNGKDKLKLKTNADQANAKVTFFDAVTKGQALEFMKLMDVLFIGCPKLTLYQYGTSPNKLIDYLLSGTFVINALCSSNDIVAESGAGVSVPSEDSAAIAKAIIETKNLPVSMRVEMGRRGREFAISKHPYSRLAKVFLKFVLD